MKIRIEKKIVISREVEYTSYIILYNVDNVPFYQYCCLSHDADKDEFILEMCKKWYAINKENLIP